MLVTTDGTVGRIAVVSSGIAGWAASNNIARITCERQASGFLAAFLSTPYGAHQLAREIYGGVVDHIDESHIESVFIPVPPQDIRAAISELVINAYEKRDEAAEIEENAIRKVEDILQKRVSL